KTGLDFAAVKWNTQGGDDLVTPADQACQDTVASAGLDYMLARLNALQNCRDNINRGRIALSPAACAQNPATERSIVRAGKHARAAISRSCGDQLPPNVSCAGTLDGLVSADGVAGCLIDTHDAAVDDVLDAEYGGQIQKTASAAINCQA